VPRSGLRAGGSREKKGTLRCPAYSSGYEPNLKPLAGLCISLRFGSFVSFPCCLHGWIVFYLLLKVWSGDDFVEAFLRFVTQEIAVPFQK
jgi:hypothetical protein